MHRAILPIVALTILAVVCRPSPVAAQGQPLCPGGNVVTPATSETQESAPSSGSVLRWLKLDPAGSRTWLTAWETHIRRIASAKSPGTPRSVARRDQVRLP